MNQTELGIMESPKPKAKHKAVIRFDGGCIGNPGAKYGSYRVRLDNVFETDRSRFQLGHGTNNEAEFESLIMGLAALHMLCKRTSIQPSETVLRVFTDSMIVRNRLMGENRVSKKPAYRARSEVMFALANECLKELRTYSSFTVEWQGRKTNVAVFGH